MRPVLLLTLVLLLLPLPAVAALPWIAPVGSREGDAAWVGRLLEPPADGVLAPAAYLRRREEAVRAYRERAWSRAAQLLAPLTAQAPEDAGLWPLLGYALYHERRYAEAEAAYREALAAGHVRNRLNLYNLACMTALQKKVDESFAWLERALAARYEDRGQIRRDGDLEALHDDPRWPAVAGLAPPGERDRVAGWRVDLDFLETEVRRLHWDFERLVRPRGFVAALDSLRARLADLDDAQVALEIQRALVRLGDGHSSLEGAAAGMLDLGILPLRLYWFADGLRVVSPPPGREDLAGAEVLAVGGVETAALPARLEGLVSRDNPMGLLAKGPLLLRMRAALRAMDLVDEESDPLYRLRRRDGAIEELRIGEGPGIPPGPLPVPPGEVEAPLYLRRTHEPYWMEPLGEGVLFVQYNMVRDAPFGPDLAAFADSLRARIDQKAPRALVVDLRHNHGGNSFLNRPLLRALIHFGNLVEDGRLYVLIGRGTFSACMNFLAEVDYYTDAITVGEPSGSSPNAVGESTDVVLPVSGLPLSISSRYHQASFPSDDRRWIGPMMPVRPTAADWLVGRDAALEAVLDHLGGG